MAKAKSITVAAALAAGLIFGSAKLVETIGQLEDGGQKAEYVVYADKLANGLPTGCNGITHHVTEEPVRVGDVWSAAKCKAITKAALTRVQGQLIGCFTRIPPQGVFDAATSLAWNVGTRKACASSAMRSWNSGKWIEGCRRLLAGDDGKLTWVYAGKKFYPGLANRRAVEIGLCVS